MAGYLLSVCVQWSDPGHGGHRRGGLILGDHKHSSGEHRKKRSNSSLHVTLLLLHFLLLLLLLLLLHLLLHFLLLPSLSQFLSYSSKVTHMRGHSGPVNCLVACKPYSIVVSGSADGTCIIWDSNRWITSPPHLLPSTAFLLFQPSSSFSIFPLLSHILLLLLSPPPLSSRLLYINSLAPHKGPVTCLAISPTLGDIATVCTTSKSSRRRGGGGGERLSGSFEGRRKESCKLTCLGYIDYSSLSPSPLPSLPPVPPSLSQLVTLSTT